MTRSLQLEERSLQLSRIGTALVLEGVDRRTLLEMCSLQAYTPRCFNFGEGSFPFRRVAILAG